MYSIALRRRSWSESDGMVEVCVELRRLPVSKDEHKVKEVVEQKEAEQRARLMDALGVSVLDFDSEEGFME